MVSKKRAYLSSVRALANQRKDNNKTNSDLVFARFPRLALSACSGFEFRLIHSLVCVSSDLLVRHCYFNLSCFVDGLFQVLGQLESGAEAATEN